MESMGEILKSMTTRHGVPETLSKLTPEEMAELRCRSVNGLEGDMHEVDGYHCNICNNKGYTFHIIKDVDEEGNEHYRETTRKCKCLKIRRSIRRMKKSGLEKTISKCTFDKYEATEKWQVDIKEKAVSFAQNVDNSVDKWFFIGGAVGCGKTHICTAISRELLLAGKELVYMLWIDDSAKLKGAVNDTQKYTEMIDPIKNAEVLYIDDFLKVARGQNGDDLQPTPADIRLAYEILNYRYQNPDLITIISSERYITEIEAIDSAVGSRIYEMTRNAACNVSRRKDRNYRTRDMEMI